MCSWVSETLNSQTRAAWGLKGVSHCKPTVTTGDRDLEIMPKSMQPPLAIVGPSGAFQVPLDSNAMLVEETVSKSSLKSPATRKEPLTDARKGSSCAKTAALVGLRKPSPDLRYRLIR